MCPKSCLPLHAPYSSIPLLCRSPFPPVVDTQDDRHSILLMDLRTPVAPCNSISETFRIQKSKRHKCAVLWCKCIFFHTHRVQAHTLTQRRCYNRPHRYDDGCDLCRKDTAQVQGPNSLSSNTADHTHDRQPLQTHKHTCILAECRAEYTALHEST